MASNWFIDGVNGTATAAGTAVGDAWDSFTVAIATLATADTAVFTKPWSVYVARDPSGYHEAVALLGSIGGANSAGGTHWYADVNRTTGWTSAVGAIDPGIVRVTLADVNEVPVTGTLIAFGTCAWNYFHNFQFDGVSGSIANSNIGVIGGTASGQTVINCVVAGSYRAFARVAATGCVALGATECFYQCNSAYAGTAYNCLAWGKFNIGPLVLTSSIQNSYVFGGAGNTIEFPISCEVSNNFIYAPGPGINWSAVGGNIAKNFHFSGLCPGRNTATLALGDFAAFCNRDGYAAAMDVSNIAYLDVGTVSVVTANSVGSVGHVIDFGPAIDMIEGIAKVCKFAKYRDYGFNFGTPASALDVEGRSRVKGYTATYVVPGPIQIPEVSLKNDAVLGNEVILSRACEEILYVPLKKSATVTINVSVSYIEDDAAPQVALVFDPAGGVATKTATATAFAGHDFAIAIAAADVPFDQTAKLILKAVATTATATAIFHSLTIT